MDRLIPLIGLIAVGAFLLLLLRMARQEHKLQAPMHPPATSMPIPPPVVLPVATPNIVNVVKDEPAVEQAQVIATRPAPTPVHSVLDLLKSKDALTTAFLLKEILGPPVSRRA
jgi:hypothetical protein